MPAAGYISLTQLIQWSHMYSAVYILMRAIFSSTPQWRYRTALKSDIGFNEKRRPIRGWHLSKYIFEADTMLYLICCLVLIKTLFTRDYPLGSGVIRTHAPEEIGALNQRLPPLGDATLLSSTNRISYFISQTGASYDFVLFERSVVQRLKRD